MPGVTTAQRAIIFFARDIPGRERFGLYRQLADRCHIIDEEKSINSIKRLAFLRHFCGDKLSKNVMDRLEWAESVGIDISPESVARFVFEYGLGGMCPQCCEPWAPRYDIYADVWAQRYIAARYGWQAPVYPGEPNELTEFMIRLETAVQDAIRSEAPIRRRAIVGATATPIEENEIPI